MGYSEDRRARIFQKTDGYCIYCGKKLSWKNYGLLNTRGCWEIDHSRPKSKGGTDHMNNLVPACIPCNRDKGDQTSSQYGRNYEDDVDESSGIGIIVGLLLLGGLYGYLRKIANRANM